MRNLTILTLLATSAMLSACGTSNRGLESVHQPVVSRTDYVFDMAAPAGDRLVAADADRLAGWFDSLGLRYGDRVSVDAPSGGVSARNAVSDIAGRYGLLVDPTPPVTQGDITPGAIRVIVSRMAASVPSCPDWSRPAAPEFNGNRTSNYGCATNSNLAAMIADPRDLIQGRSADASIDAVLSSKAIRSYRAAPLTGAGALKSETTKGN